jgi:thiol-disulfide isomerase/thioredoxin
MIKYNVVSLNMMKKLIFFVFFLTFIFGSFSFILAQGKVEVNFFYSQTCPYCAKEKIFLDELKEKYPEVEIKEYEITQSWENQELLKSFYEKYQVPKGKQGWVPVTFTPTEYFIGFNQQIAAEIENCLKECLGKEKIISQEIKIPFFGKVDLSKMSLPVLTLTLGALDGFNPCAMWVLLFLIALIINTRSRKRMWLIGGTFLAVSGIVYFLILAAWLNLFLAISYVNLTRILIGIFAVGVGVWQIRNFIKFRPGVCEVTDGKSSFQGKIKDGLRKHAEKIAFSPFTFALLGGTILLALGVNLVEFFCSAGLPAIFTRILALQNLNSLVYYSYLLLYTFVFMLDDIIIFSIAVITLTKFGFTEKYNYWTTLIGGLLILILGILLIFRPELLMFG